MNDLIYESYAENGAENFIVSVLVEKERKTSYGTF